jgi:hypothetical protein
MRFPVLGTLNDLTILSVILRPIAPSCVRAVSVRERIWMSFKMTQNHQVVNGSPYLTGSFVNSLSICVRSCPYSWRILSIRNQQVAGSNPAGGSRMLPAKSTDFLLNERAKELDSRDPRQTLKSI